MMVLSHWALVKSFRMSEVGGTGCHRLSARWGPALSCPWRLPPPTARQQESVAVGLATGPGTTEGRR